jgi:ribonucleotide reductase alpha subunit
VDYVSQRAGIGIDISEMRPHGSSIRGGDATHTGMIPFIKLFESSTKSCSQGGVRSGAATLYVPIWSKEIEDLIVLKNNKGTQDNRVRGLDYGIQINQHFYEKAINKEKYMLFSPHDYPDMYDAFFRNQTLFASLYEKYSKAKNVKFINAWDLLIALVGERVQTGRIYIFNVDRVSNQKTYIESTVYSSNLCLVGDTEVEVRLVHETSNEYLTITMTELDQLFRLGKNVYVLSYNTETNQHEYKKVTDSAQTGKNAKLVKVTDTLTGKSIKCTPEHRVYTNNRGYVEARNLLPDDVLVIK